MVYAAMWENLESVMEWGKDAESIYMNLKKRQKIVCRGKVESCLGVRKTSRKETRENFLGDVKF